MNIMFKRVLFSLLTAGGLTACGVATNYVGKSYPATESVDLFVSWADVERPFETMGCVTAYGKGYVFGFGSPSSAQAKIERLAREKGADAVVIALPEQNARRTTVEEYRPDGHGGATHSTSTTMSRVETEPGKLTATLIKYK